MTCTQVQDGMKSFALALLSTFPRAGDVSGQRSEIEQSGAERRRGFRYPLPERNARAPRAELKRGMRSLSHTCTLRSTLGWDLLAPRFLCIEIPTRCVSCAVAVTRRVRTGECVARCGWVPGCGADLRSAESMAESSARECTHIELWKRKNAPDRKVRMHTLYILRPTSLTEPYLA